MHAERSLSARGRCLAAAGAAMVCNVVVSNTGNVRLTSIAVSSGSCSLTAPLLPGDNTTCSVMQQAVQEDFERGGMTVAVTASATSMGTNPTPAAGSDSKAVVLVVNRLLDLWLVRQATADGNSTAPVSWAGDMVHLSLTAANAGNINLYNVTFGIPALGTLNCVNGSDGSTPVALPAEVVPVGQHLMCSGSFNFSQDALEAGGKVFTATGFANGLATSSNQVLVTAVASPSLAVDVDAPNCIKPSRMRKQQHIFQRIGMHPSPC